MTQRVRDGLGLPAGIYRVDVGGGGPVVYVPNGITADGVESFVCANVVPVSGGYDGIVWDNESDVYALLGNPNPSPTHFNDEFANFFADTLREIFSAAQPGDSPYFVKASENRANIIADLANMKADFYLVVV